MAEGSMATKPRSWLSGGWVAVIGSGACSSRRARDKWLIGPARRSAAGRRRHPGRRIDLRQVAPFADIERRRGPDRPLAKPLFVKQRLIFIDDLDEHHCRSRRCRHFGAFGPHARKVGASGAAAGVAKTRFDIEIAIAALPVNPLAVVVIAFDAGQDDASARPQVQAFRLPFGAGEHLIDVDLAHAGQRQVAANRDARRIVGGAETDLADTRVGERQACHFQPAETQKDHQRDAEGHFDHHGRALVAQQPKAAREAGLAQGEGAKHLAHLHITWLDEALALNGWLRRTVDAVSVTSFDWPSICQVGRMRSNVIDTVYSTTSSAPPLPADPRSASQLPVAFMSSKHSPGSQTSLPFLSVSGSGSPTSS